MLTTTSRLIGVTILLTASSLAPRAGGNLLDTEPETRNSPVIGSELQRSFGNRLMFDPHQNALEFELFP